MKFTKHAMERWKERFSNLSKEYEFSRAKKPSKIVMIDIKKQCPQHRSIMKNRSIYGLEYKMAPSGVVFVCNKDDVVITVFPYITNTTTGRREERRIYLKGKRIKHIHAKNKW